MTVLSSIAAVVTAVTALLAVLGGYVQLVLRRSLLPAVEFDVDFAARHPGTAQLIGEPSCTIKNSGSNMLIVTNVRCRIRYRLSTDPEEQWSDGVEPAFGHGVPWFFLAQKRTFVQPGVSQPYRKPVALPSTTQVVDIVGSFDYRIQVGPVTSALVGVFARPPKDLDWRRGIRNHTARRVVAL